MTSEDKIKKAMMDIEEIKLNLNSINSSIDSLGILIKPLNCNTCNKKLRTIKSIGYVDKNNIFCNTCR